MSLILNIEYPRCPVDGAGSAATAQNLGVLLLKKFWVMLTPFKSVFSCLPLVLGYLNRFVIVVAPVLEGAVIT